MKSTYRETLEEKACKKISFSVGETMFNYLMVNMTTFCCMIVENVWSEVQSVLSVRTCNLLHRNIDYMISWLKVDIMSLLTKKWRQTV